MDYLFLGTSVPLLTGPGGDYTEPVVLRSIAEFGRKAVEHAGHAYHVRWVARFAPKPVRSRKIVTSSTLAAQEQEDAAERKRMSLIVDMSDLYRVLNLAESNSTSAYTTMLYTAITTLALYSLRDASLCPAVNATDDQIRNAYRKLVLVFHPDKKGGAGGSVDAAPDPTFLALQKAFDVLSNEDKRRRYDSQYAFDDSIPAEKADPSKDFFATFRPVFERNARFSSIHPVPSLGDADTPPEEVQV
jgi:hypothetical protein